MVDWSEIEKLQADFQKTQNTHNLQKFSERNCVEILVKLQEMNLLTVLHTIDGKEYITPNHLKKEIKDELYIHHGRISLVELQQLLNVDFSHIESKCKELVKSDRHIQIIYGQLIEDSYLDRLAEEINDNLQSVGFVKIAEVSKESDLPGEFLIPELVSRMGSKIKGQIDEHNKDVIFTDAYLARQKALIRGMLSAATKPTNLQVLTTAHGLSVHLVHTLLDTLLQEGRVNGQITGGRSEKALFHPSIYTQTQDNWIESFYKQNNYIEYQAVSKLGISDAKSYLKKKFANRNALFLNTVCMSMSWKDRVTATLEETFAENENENEWINVMCLLPSSLSFEDGNQLIQSIFREKSKDKMAEKYVIYADTIVTNANFAQSCLKFFQGLINEKAHAASKKSSILALTEQERKEYLSSTSLESTTKRGAKKDDRRKKAVEITYSSKKGNEGGGSNSGTGTREVKTRGKDKKRMKWAKEHDTGGESKSSKSESAEIFMNHDEIVDVLTEKLGDCPEEVLQQVAEKLMKPLQQTYQTTLHSVFLTISKTPDSTTHTKQSRKVQLKQAEEELMMMWNKARLYYDGVQLFEADDNIKSNLEKYLIKSVGLDVANKIFLLNTTDNMTDIDTSVQLTGEMRIKIISLSPDNIKQHLTKLNSSINGKSFDILMECVKAATTACGIMLRQNDKKKDRLVIHGNRKSLLEQMDKESGNPAMVLHLASSIIFQSVFGSMLHSPGRHVPDVLDKLESSLERDVYSTLMKSQDLIQQKMILEQKDEHETDEVRVEELNCEMQEVSNQIRELAVTTKKKK